MSALTDVAKQAMEYFCDRGSVDTYSEEWGFYLALRYALAQEPNPQMHEKSLGTAISATTPALRDAAQQALEALDSDNPDIQLRAAISLRAALEREQAEPVQEPVAWMCPDDPERETAFSWDAGHCENCGTQRSPLYAALELNQDPELSAALGWPGGISDPVLDRKTLLQQVARMTQRTHGIGEEV